jgi:hypothetical protein
MRDLFAMWLRVLLLKDRTFSRLTVHHITGRGLDEEEEEGDEVIHHAMTQKRKAK